MYQWTKQSGSHRSSLDPHPPFHLSRPLARGVRAWTHLNGQSAMFHPGGERKKKEGKKFHRNTPKHPTNSVLLWIGREGEQRHFSFRHVEARTRVQQLGVKGKKNVAKREKRRTR